VKKTDVHCCLRSCESCSCLPRCWCFPDRRARRAATFIATASRWPRNTKCVDRRRRRRAGSRNRSRPSVCGQAEPIGTGRTLGGRSAARVNSAQGMTDLIAAGPRGCGDARGRGREVSTAAILGASPCRRSSRSAPSAPATPSPRAWRRESFAARRCPRPRDSPPRAAWRTAHRTIRQSHAGGRSIGWREQVTSVRLS